MGLVNFLEMFPPMPTDEEIQKVKNATAGSLFPITVCECDSKNFMHRLGCRCGGRVRWLWQDKSGSILECGVDFSPLPDENDLLIIS